MPKDWEKRLEQLGPPGGAKGRGRAPGVEPLMVDRSRQGGASVPAGSAAPPAETGRALKPLVLLAAVQAILLVVIAVLVARYAGVL